LGGQEQYRDNYLKELNAHFSETDKLIFVIDVQDEDRYSLALEYLRSVINSVKANFPDLETSIFLHKYDPPLEMHSALNQRIEESLIQPLKKIIPPSYKYKIYKTSIYTVFKKSFL